MPWSHGKGRTQAQLVKDSDAWAGRVAPFLARVFEAEHFFLRGQEPRNDSEIMDALTEAMQATRARKEAWYRRVFLGVGAEFAEDGDPGEARRDDPTLDDPDAWGEEGDDWWRESWSPTIATRPWFKAWMGTTHAYTAQHYGNRVAGIDDHTKHRLQQHLSVGVQAGEGIHDLMKRVDSLYLDDIIPNRSEVIARTESLNAARAASFNAVRAAGYSKRVVKSWLHSGDDRVRSTHLAAGSQVDVPFEEPFIVENPSTGAMEAMLFPGDGSMGAGAANIIQCRCDSLRRLT